MFHRAAWLIVFVYSFSAHGLIPDPYVLQVQHQCGDDAMTDAYATIVTDLDVSAKAVCAGGEVDFTHVDPVNLLLHVSYPGQGSSPCVFKQRTGSKVFVVTVLVSFGELDHPIHQKEEEYTLTCTFDPQGTNKSSSLEITDGLVAPVEFQKHVGDLATGTTFLLTLTDILGRGFTDPISVGRVVQLKASAAGGMSEVGVRPTACDAVAMSGSTTKRYAILRGGCGDGLVFKKKEGFIVEGLVARSPFFESFSLIGESRMKFECNFTLCMTDCNGSTCLNEQRRRRSAPTFREGRREETASLIRMESKLHMFRERKRRWPTKKLLENVVKTSN